jgi:hypothetical protein
MYLFLDMSMSNVFVTYNVKSFTELHRQTLWKHVRPFNWIFDTSGYN